MDISNSSLDSVQGGPVALTPEIMRKAGRTVAMLVPDQTLARQILDSLGILEPLRAPAALAEVEEARQRSRRPSRNYPVSATRRYS